MRYKFCSNCGKKIKINVKFCPFCGAKQTKNHKINKNNRKTKTRKSIESKKANHNTKHHQKKLLKKKNKRKHSLYVKRGHVTKKQLFGTIAGLIVAFFLIFACTKIYQVHHYHAEQDQATAIFKNDINNDTHWKIGSGKFSNDSMDVHIMMSDDTYDISGGEIEDVSNDNNSPASYSVKHGTISMTDIMNAIGNDNSFNDSNTNQMFQQASNGNYSKGTIDMDKDDKDLVKGALKTQSDNNFVLFRSTEHPSQFILFQRQ